ncbi:Glutathione peroxidase, house-cleaning role in reducing lipid peroxides [Granulicella pectinivorans]|uniref:Glutathione peroxidase, house-cleaning role in reducing lipid peroxides n=1 Tax=Granulicella pectinivorans TaxID=474950 RepID=A0A1I6MDT3_9BACT|nr:TlpA disulfide reductase family protein [Granulicella pectinivorans]SFS13910.1 Glutathione peroxidase, house-cleaning role in reducing lipid peroxides [Granulicella pectinivorans]
MKLSASVLALSFGACFGALVVPSSVAQTAAQAAGVWQGFATARGNQQVPITIRISGSGTKLKAAFLNGPAAHPDETIATTATLDGSHLVASFDYFARTLDATVSGNTLSGTYGPAHPSAKSAPPTPFTLTRIAKETDPEAAPHAPDISGSWEIATKSNKGEGAWEFRVDPPLGKSPVIKAVIQRIDGDTGGLWGTWNGTSFNVSHFTAAGPAIYSVTPQPDGTLVIKSLLGPVHDSSPNLVARRTVDARKLNLPTPTDPTQQTTLKDPTVPLAFSFPDLNGKIVSNTDPQFQGKVVIVAIGGSWCPNCHDEAPFLVSLYKKFHSKGLEIVNLDFEQGDPDTDTARLKAFIAHYGITYPVLVSGTTDQLAEKIPQGVNLNCWPTSFFVGRDGLVKETHAGFAGPGNTAGHIALEHDVTALIEKLLSERPTHQAVHQGN